jgi:orotidine-5'-phosphate decarboxylase
VGASFLLPKKKHSSIMQTMNFSETLEAAVKEKGSILMLGLDPNPDKFPEGVSKDAKGALEFCTEIMKATHDLVCGVKIQMAYFEQFGAEGIKAVEILLKLAKELKLITLVDGKRNDIGATAEAYAKAYFGKGSPLECDAMTVNPLLGTDGILPFLNYCEKDGKGIFVLVRTSNPSAIEFQGGESEISLRIAEMVESWNVTTQSEKNMFSAVGAVIGATIEPEFLNFFREEMPHTWFLCPGVGAQGGDMDAVKAVQTNGLGVIVPVSRSVLYAGSGKDYAKAARVEMENLFQLQQ